MLQGGRISRSGGGGGGNNDNGEMMAMGKLEAMAGTDTMEEEGGGSVATATSEVRTQG